MQDTCRNSGVTVVVITHNQAITAMADRIMVITHNQAITAMADRIITVKNGLITDMRMNGHIVPVEQIEW